MGDRTRYHLVLGPGEVALYSVVSALLQYSSLSLTHTRTHTLSLYFSGWLLRSLKSGMRLL